MKMKKSTIIAFAVLLLISVFIDANRNTLSVPIIVYDNVAEVASPDGKTVAVSKFENDIKWLTEYGCGMVLPRDLVNGEKVPDKPVLLTFDGGYKTFYEYVYPLLQKYNVKAELAVNVSKIDENDPKYCSWDELREMSESGYVEIGSLGYELANNEKGVAKLDGEQVGQYRERVLADITKSATRLDEELEAKIYCFTYPKGYYESDSKSTVKDSFKVSFITKEKTALINNKFLNLSRYTVTQEISLPVLFKVN